MLPIELKHQSEQAAQKLGFEISDHERLVSNPRVSVLMITYNHAEYLAEAIESVMAQRCEFEFELIIGEDASGDTTRDVALMYQRRYPERIRVVLSEQNVGMNANSERIFRRARGEYVAYCEGDDFWCDPRKLAKQVELIRSDQNIGIVHCDWVRAHYQNGGWRYNLRNSVHRRVSIRYLQGDLFKTWHYPKILRTCTILLRKTTVSDFYDSGIMNYKYRFGDSVLTVWVTSRFKVGYVPSVMSVYRVSPNSALRSGARSRVAFYISALEFDRNARVLLSDTCDYHCGYRWDAIAGLLLWGLRAGDLRAIFIGLGELRNSFTLRSFLATGYKTLVMRVPTLSRQHRSVPSDSIGG